jgi:hypothetical protein
LSFWICASKQHQILESWLIPVIRWRGGKTFFFLIKTNRCTNFPNLFCQETLHVSGSSSAHHQEFSTVHSALVYVMQVWWRLSCTTRMELELEFHRGHAWKLSSYLHDVYQCWMYSGKLLMMGRGTAWNM